MTFELAVLVFMGCWVFVAILGETVYPPARHVIAPSDIDPGADATTLEPTSGTPEPTSGTPMPTYAEIAQKNLADDQAEITSWRARRAEEWKRLSDGGYIDF
jgi:hypothetical protein